MGRTHFLPTSLKIVAAVGAALLVCGLLLAYASSPAHADTIFKVNSTGDENDLNFPGGTLDGSSDAKCDVDTTLEGDQCTLRAAIQEANVTAGNDTIDIGITGTVNLTGVLPDLSSNIAIKGPGADKFTVRRPDTAVDNYRIFHVTGGTVVSISGVTISNGIGVPWGGGVFNEGGTLTISDSTISNNTAICSSMGSCAGGGGVVNYQGTLTISDSTIRDNSTPQFGGGVYTFHGVLTISDSTISGNSSGPFGGGVYSQPMEDGEASITNTTISGNSTGSNGGGVYSGFGHTIIKYSTITDNTAPDGGGGVFSFFDSSTTTEVLSSIISANTNNDDVTLGDVRSNTFLSKGYNLIGDGNATGDDDPTTDDNAFDQPGDQIGVTDPKLDSLGSYGGPTQTHRLQSDSPAVDAGPPTDGDPIACPPPGTDQRGVPRAQGTACDIGAFEVGMLANNDSYNVGEDGTLTAQAPGLLGNDVGSPPVTVKDADDQIDGIQPESQPSHGTLTLKADGSFTYTPDANYNGTDTFTYKASDGSADSDVATVTIDVTLVNDKPTVEVAAGGSCGTNDRSGKINLIVKDPDGLAGLPLSAASSNTTLVPASNVTFGGTGASRTVTATAVSGKTGTATITVTVSDGTDAGTVALTLQAGGNSNNTLTGTDPTPTLSGTDILLGQNGDDTLSGLGGIDLLCGARGNDRLTGGTGADFFSGGSGTDTATDFNASQGDTRVGIP